MSKRVLMYTMDEDEKNNEPINVRERRHFIKMVNLWCI